MKGLQNVLELNYSKLALQTGKKTKKVKLQTKPGNQRELHFKILLEIEIEQKKLLFKLVQTSSKCCIVTKISKLKI